MLGALAAVIVPRADEVGDALDRVGIGTFLLVVLLGVIAMILRTSAWQVAIDAAGGQVRAAEAHAASAASYVVGLISPYLGVAARIAVIRSRLPDRSPSTSQQIAAESVLLVVEGALVCLLIVCASWTLEISLPVAVLVLLGGFAGVALLVLAARRFASRRFGAGLAVAKDPRALALTTAAVAGTSATQIVRVAVVLSAVGMDADPLVVVAVFLASGLGAVIPIGTAASGAAAPLIAASAGAGSVADATAAGVLMTGGLLVSTLSYLAVTTGLLALHGTSAASGSQEQG